MTDTKRIGQMQEIARTLTVLAENATDRADMCKDSIDHGYELGRAAAYRNAARMLRAVTEEVSTK